ncbi:Uncharacterised protein [Mycobacterium tuberculosis]|uniref:Uncharacterized protein n=1 Tax=Mycobacterium tuberculosis TaxID=1773 RepID=A0A0U0QR89_MYCTX|nr:Uncharacterised protein [Mycobacterium tuberculosis]
MTGKSSSLAASSSYSNQRASVRSCASTARVIARHRAASFSTVVGRGIAGLSDARSPDASPSRRVKDDSALMPTYSTPMSGSITTSNSASRISSPTRPGCHHGRPQGRPEQTPPGNRLHRLSI